MHNEIRTELLTPLGPGILVERSNVYRVQVGSEELSFSYEAIWKLNPHMRRGRRIRSGRKR